MCRNTKIAFSVAMVFGARQAEERHPHLSHNGMAGPCSYIASA
jgi:hypothetical protein